MAGNFSYLPMDCVHNIFDRLESKDLKAASLTCKSFNLLANEWVYDLRFDADTVSSWISSFSNMLVRFRNVKAISFRHLPKNLMGYTLYEIAECGLHLEYLCLPGRMDDEDPFPVQQLRNIASTSLSLKYVNCSFLVMDDHEFSVFANIFTNIKGLDMSWGSSYLTNEGFENGSTMLHNLQKIDISFINQVSDEWLVSLSKNCPMLEEVTCISSNAFISEGALIQLLGGCSRMCRVVVGNFYFNMVHFPLAQVVYDANYLRYMEIDYVIIVDKDGGVEPSSAAQIKELFLDAWEEEHGR